MTNTTPNDPALASAKPAVVYPLALGRQTRVKENGGLESWYDVNDAAGRHVGMVETEYDAEKMGTSRAWTYTVRGYTAVLRMVETDRTFTVREHGTPRKALAAARAYVASITGPVAG